MKKVITHLFALASIAALFVACNKEIDIQKSKTEGTHTVTFVTEQIDTRTQVVPGENSASYIWNESDAQYLHVKENGTAGTISSLVLSDNGRVGTITATFPNSEAESFVYKGYYYGEETNTHNPKVLDTQNPKANSFDPKSDVLISDETAPGPAQASLTLRFGRVAVISKMTLKGMTAGEVVSKVTLTGSAALAGSYAEATGEEAAKWNPGSKTLTFENFENATVNENGEFPIYFVSIPFEGTISVSVTTDQNQYDRNDIAATLKFEVGKLARFGINLQDYGTPITTGATYALVNSASDFVDGANYLIVGAAEVNSVLTYFAMGAQSSNGNNRTAVVAPHDATNNTITVSTDVKAYPIKIQSTTDGYYLIDNYEDSENYGHYLYNASTSTKNLLKSKAAPGDDCVWTVSISGGVTTIVNVGNTTRNIIYFNYSSQGQLFNNYASQGTNKTIALYIDNSNITPALDTPVIATSSEGSNLTVVWTDVLNAASYKVTCTGQSDQTVAPGVEYYTFSDLEDGIYTVTVTAISDDHTAHLDSAPASATEIVGTPALGKPVISAFTETNTGFSATISAAVENATSYDWDLYEGSVDVDGWVGTGNTEDLSFAVPFADTDITEFEAGVTYYLVITAMADGFASTESDPASFVATGGYAFTTVAGLNGLATSTATSQSGKLTDAVISFVSPDKKTAVIKDATGSVLYYSKNAELSLLQGQTYSGELTVTVTVYNSCAQITSCSANFTGSGAVVNPDVVALSDLVGHLAQYQNAYVQVNDLTVVSKNGKNINVSNGDNTYVVYDNTSEASCVAGDVISAKGTITHYDRDNIDELKVWTADAITITTPHTPTTHTITITQPTGEAAEAGCSISAKVDGATISSPASVAEGKTVTLSYVVGEGYSFGSWSVTGASLNGNSFEVGTSDVTVSANFTKNSQGGEVTLQYTLNGVNNKQGTNNNAYAEAHVLTFDGITWSLEGNLDMDPWRLGGKGLTNINRVFYSETPITANISKIEVASGTAGNSLTVNSLTITVHSSASDAENGVNAIATKYVDSSSDIVSKTVTLEKEGSESWAGKYYRIVYNVSSGTSKNGYIEFKTAKFYGN